MSDKNKKKGDSFAPGSFLSALGTACRRGADACRRGFAASGNFLGWHLAQRWHYAGVLRDVRENLSRIPETRELLDLADRNGVKIRFDRGLREDNFFGGVYNSGTREISINPDSKNPEATLIHELRHHYQDHVLGTMNPIAFAPHGISFPRAALFFNRVIEADAYAFEHYVMRKIKRRQERLAEMMDDVIDFSKKKNRKMTTDELEGLHQRFDDKYRDADIQAEMDDVTALQKNFFAQMQGLDSYDLRRVTFFAKVATGDEEVQLPEKEVSMDALRNMLRLGVEKDAPRYMLGLGNKKLDAYVLAPVKNDIRKVCRLMTKFNAAARKTDKFDASPAAAMMRDKIREAVVAAHAARPETQVLNPVGPAP